MTLHVNGEPRVVAASTIAELVAALALPAAAVLVEHNGTALRRDEWPERRLAEGDRLEIIRIVAGG
jgi:thiamine biosynthesis protein ThiS